MAPSFRSEGFQFNGHVLYNFLCKSGGSLTCDAKAKDLSEV